jgi:hypothetical protein
MDDNTTHDYVCPEEGCGWTSRGWDTKKAATERGKEHKAEHETGDPMPELAETKAVAR